MTVHNWPPDFDEWLDDRALDIWQLISRARALAALARPPLRIPEWIDRFEPYARFDVPWAPESNWTDATWLVSDPEAAVQHALRHIDWQVSDAQKWLAKLRSRDHRAGMTETLRRHDGRTPEGSHSDARWDPSLVDLNEMTTRLKVGDWLSRVLLAYRKAEPSAAADNPQYGLGACLTQDELDLDQSLEYWLGLSSERVSVVVATQGHVLGAAAMKSQTDAQGASWGIMLTERRRMQRRRGCDHVIIPVAYSDVRRELELELERID